MEITIENKKYEINLERAKELGIAKEILLEREPKIGDIYKSSVGGSRVVIVSLVNEHGPFRLGGCAGNSCSIFPGSFQWENVTQLKEFLNHSEFEFTGTNINVEL